MFWTFFKTRRLKICVCVCVCEAINRLCVWHTSCHSSNFPVQYMRKTSVFSNWLNVHTRIKYYVSCTFLFFFFTRRIFFDKFGRKVFMFLKRIKWLIVVFEFSKQIWMSEWTRSACSSVMIWKKNFEKRLTFYEKYVFVIMEIFFFSFITRNQPQSRGFFWLLNIILLYFRVFFFSWINLNLNAKKKSTYFYCI